MTGVFGEVAGVYDESRPGYPAEVAADILAYHGGRPSFVVELGAGTGKGTEVLTRLGAPVTCVEPDPRMAAVLTAKFPAVTVDVVPFERWPAPAGGTPLIGCAMAWHWLDPATRNQRVHDALTPGGTLAVFGHHYGYADPEQDAALDAAFRSVDPAAHQPAAGWFHQDIVASGRFTAVRRTDTERRMTISADHYLRLVQTFGPFRRASADDQSTALREIRSTLQRFGDTLVLKLRTSLVLARRPA